MDDERENAKVLVRGRVASTSPLFSGRSSKDIRAVQPAIERPLHVLLNDFINQPLLAPLLSGSRSLLPFVPNKTHAERPVEELTRKRDGATGTNRP